MLDEFSNYLITKIPDINYYTPVIHFCWPTDALAG